jgi:hypothetical protein
MDRQMINRGSALDERRGPHDDSPKILVKTPGNNSSLRLNAKSRIQDDLLVWEVTLPLAEPIYLIKKNYQWVSAGQSKADISLIEAIGQAIDKQL